MTIYHTGQGAGVDYRDEYGRRRRKFVGSEAAAKALEAQLHEEVAGAKKSLRQFSGSEMLTLGEGAEMWMASLPVGEVRRQKLQQTLKQLTRELANMKVSQVTPKLLSEYAAKRGTEIAPSTQAHENGAIKAFMQYLHERWYLPSNPASGLSTKCPRSSPGIAITYAEEHQLLNAARTNNTRLKLLLALDGGMRVSEITALRREHWNREENTIVVFSHKTRHTRIVPLTKRLREQLETTAKNTTPGERLTSGEAEHKNATDFLRSMRRRGLPAPRFHDLRHTYASRVAAVAKLYVVRDLLGHAPRNSTDFYLHASAEEKRAAMEAMEAANPNINAQLKPVRKKKGAAKEEEEMPGKRYTLRVKGEAYGIMNGERVRPTENQAGATPGTVRVEAQRIPGAYIVRFIDLELIEQPSTLPKKEKGDA